MQQIHIFISGKVQGVGYRQFVKYQAKKRQVTGWVRNLRDGRVEAVLRGDQDKMDEIITICYKGPFLAHVAHIDTHREEVTSELFHTFTVLK